MPEGISCLRKDDGFVVVDQPNHQSKAAYATCGLSVPPSFSLEDYAIETGL